MTLSIASGKRRARNSADATFRPLRRCVRCGREGRNAFRPIRGSTAGAVWLCSHAEPCHERSRLQQRAAAKRAQGRPSQSPISGWSLDDHRVLVLGTDPAARTSLETLLSDVTSADVESLHLDRRSIDLVGRRELGMVVADVRHGDPVALLNGLARRLSRLVWRGIPVVLIHGQSEMSPAIEALVRDATTHVLTRPVEAADLVSVLSRLAVEPAAAPAV